MHSGFAAVLSVNGIIFLYVLMALLEADGENSENIDGSPNNYIAARGRRWTTKKKQ